jgi:IMP cyclohydrolase
MEIFLAFLLPFAISLFAVLWVKVSHWREAKYYPEAYKARKEQELREYKERKRQEDEACKNENHLHHYVCTECGDSFHGVKETWEIRPRFVYD